MDSIVIKAYAKINPVLDVVRRLENGYHELNMIMAEIPLYDEVFVKKTAAEGIILKCEAQFVPSDERNIAWKAAALMQKEYKLPGGLFISIDKHIPVAAGLAGGSTDAAAVLKAVNLLYNLELSEQELKALGLKLGADVPFCISGKTALSQGIGEVLTPLPGLPKCRLLLVKPPVGVSTEHAYKSLVLNEKTFHPDVDAAVAAIKEGNLSELCKNLGNVLESSTIPEHPEIAEIKEKMISLGAVNSLMSGSGPSVFGIFTDKNAAEHAFYEFKVGEYGKQTFLLTIG